MSFDVEKREGEKIRVIYIAIAGSRKRIVIGQSWHDLTGWQVFERLPVCTESFVQLGLRLRSP